LVIHGDTDPVVPLAHGRWYAAEIAGARLEVLEGAGHAFLLTFRPVATALVSAAVA
jgi:pimeloyl-ACP methyl ester carboxylesterase